MQLFLIRHPQPDVAAGICYGQTDLALPKHQHHQLGIIAQTLQQQLPSEFVVYTSPLQRCRLLAEQLHASPLVDDRLKEMHFGEWEMQAWDALPRDQLDAWAQDPLHYVVPGGESVAQLHARAGRHAGHAGHDDEPTLGGCGGAEFDVLHGRISSIAEDGAAGAYSSNNGSKAAGIAAIFAFNASRSSELC